MTLDTTTPRSRRAILAASLGGLAATAAAALGRPEQARATDGLAIIQGADNSGTQSTVVRITGGVALQGVADATAGTNYGLRGRNSSSDGAGVLGVGFATAGSSAGVRGLSSSPNGYGVYGGDPLGSYVGVLGRSGTNYAVAGYSSSGGGVVGGSGSGVGGYFSSGSGNALHVDGKASFSRSGRTSIPINAAYVDVTVPGGLGSSANVLALLQASRSGVWVRAVRINYPSAGKARIYLNKVASTSVKTPVAWFVLN